MIRLCYLMLACSTLCLGAPGDWKDKPTDTTTQIAGVLGTNRVALELTDRGSGPDSVVAYIVTLDSMAFTGQGIEFDGDSFRATFPEIGATVRGTRRDEGYAIDWSQPGFKSSVDFEFSDEPGVEERKRVTGLGVHPRAPLATAEFAFLVGEWHGRRQRLGPNGEYMDVGSIDWKGEWILDGMAVQNTSRTQGRAGNVVQWGLDTRIYNLREERWDHRYMNALGGNFLSLSWEADEDGVLVSSMTAWPEPGGKMADHIIRIEVIDEDTFRWTADLSWDGGKSWIRESEVNVNRRVAKAG